MSVHWPIIRRLITNPRYEAVVDDQRRWKSIELLVGAMHLAAEIERRSKTKTVGLLLPTAGVFPMAMLATWFLGRTIVPINYLLKREEMQYIIDHCETDIVLTVKPLVEFAKFEPEVKNLVYLEDLSFKGIPKLRIPARKSKDDLATLLYTSGTSGKPKGVMLTHGNLKANLWQCVGLAKFARNDTFLGVLPQFHSFGFTVLTLLPLTIGARVVYTARFVPNKIFNLFRTEKPTVFIGIPSMYGALASSKSGTKEDLKSLRFAVSGGEPLPEAVSSAFRERFGVIINEGYGMTETAPVTNVCLPEEFRPHSVGRCVPDLEMRIVDPENGKVLDRGNDGEVRMRGPNVMKGYYKMPEETKESFDDDGFLRSGDLGRFDEDGHLYITGRIKDMIIVGGENVFPREIEEVLNAHESVAASGVVGMQDSVRGELPIAFVELEEDAEFDEKALKAWCRERLAGYKVPREIRHMEKLPRTASGKIVRRDLRDLLKEEPASGE